MSLRAKCALLLLAFEITLGVTIYLTVRYITIYFEEAEQNFSSAFGPKPETKPVIAMATAATRSTQPPPTELEQAIADMVASADVLRHAVKRSLGEPEAAEIDRLMVRIKTAGQTYTEQGSAAELDQAPFLALVKHLQSVEAKVDDAAKSSVDRSVTAQENAILLLFANMIVAAGLGIAGMLLVRKWVLLPIQELKQSTDELGRGNLEHKARVISQDELGQLAAAFNQMSSDLARIERQLIQRERLAAMGELISYVAHNIRNPLAGIQSSADACRRQLAPDSELRSHHDEIVYAIDRFQRWLRQLEQTCSPLELNAGPADIHEIIDNVVTVFKPISERRSISIERASPNGLKQVKIDERHFEHALAAIVGNAIDAAGDNGRVTIGAGTDEDPRHWSLYVTDTGPGISPDLRPKIFEPTYSTKRSGHGLGLTMAKKIVELHGGEITVDCPPHGGTTFRFSMPTEPVVR